jgi:hypothetical protein
MTDIGGFTPSQARETWDVVKLLRSSGLLRNLSKVSLPDDPGLAQVLVKNESGEAIPAFACMEILGTEVVDDRTFLKVTKPTKTDGKYIFNHDREIEEDGLGMALPWGVVRMLGDDPGEPTEHGATVGAWTVQEEAGGPFVVYGADAYGTGIVKGRITGGGSGNLQIIQFTLTEDYYGAEEVPEMCIDREPNEGALSGRVGQKACGSGAVYGADEDGIVDLTDPLGITQNRDYRDLVNRTGIAVLMASDEEYNYEPICQWVIVYIDFHRQVDVVSDIIFGEQSITIERKRITVWDDCKLPDEVIEGEICEEAYYDGGGV